MVLTPKHSGLSTAPGPCLNIKTVFPGMGIPMLKIRRSQDRLIFNMGIPLPVRHLYIEAAPESLHGCHDVILSNRLDLDDAKWSRLIQSIVWCWIWGIPSAKYDDNSPLFTRGRFNCNLVYKGMILMQCGKGFCVMTSSSWSVNLDVHVYDFVTMTSRNLADKFDKYLFQSML